jgi:predicted GNAT family acetyltransferase
MNTIIRGLSTRVAKMADKVEWDKTRKTFVLNLPNKDEAIVEYEDIDANTWDFAHTFVPESARGGGVASKVVKGAFEYAVENNKKVIPSCWYVKDVFLPKHPEYAKNVINAKI